MIALFRIPAAATGFTDSFPLQAVPPSPRSQAQGRGPENTQKPSRPSSNIQPAALIHSLELSLFSSFSLLLPSPRHSLFLKTNRRQEPTDTFPGHRLRNINTRGTTRLRCCNPPTSPTGHNNHDIGLASLPSTFRNTQHCAHPIAISTLGPPRSVQANQHFKAVDLGRFCTFNHPRHAHRPGRHKSRLSAAHSHLYGLGGERQLWSTETTHTRQLSTGQTTIKSRVRIRASGTLRSSSPRTRFATAAAGRFKHQLRGQAVPVTETILEQSKVCVGVPSEAAQSLLPKGFGIGDR